MKPTIMPRHPILILLASTAVLLTSMVQARTLNVSLILSDSSPPYQQFADSFNSTLAAGKADVSIVEAHAIDDTGAADLIVAVGMKAAELTTAQTHTPVLVAMVPEAGYKRLLAQLSSANRPLEISVIYLNQPWDRQLDFLRAALPKQHKIGLLYSPDSGIDIEGLRRDIAERGGSMIALSVRSEDELFEKLSSVLTTSDVLLAIPDSMIFSSNNIRNIMLASYRHRVPLIGLSQAYVTAGALGAIFSTPVQLAEQTGAAVESFSLTGQFPKPQYPVSFTIAINQQVARSLEIAVPAPETIRKRMEKMDGSAP